ncbi:CLUMA_CG013698, isoform A [Clunio marinus]|uniref:CLUMA_CG013698, isoform A n=1 Tax=Clunio marinus TaxID=568069 RepID=A0A1J1IJR4_9DIPT|nr:CLUMA_CG013698, isoform A [Clunio marinus]
MFKKFDFAISLNTKINKKCFTSSFKTCDKESLANMRQPLNCLFLVAHAKWCAKTKEAKKEEDSRHKGRKVYEQAK